MKISSRVDYALSCAARIADKYESRKPVSVSYVAKKECLEPDYAEQLLIKMKRAGILKSIRGAEGGYVLARSPDKISAKDILVAIEKDILRLVCSREKGRRKSCIHIKDCRVKKVWVGLKNKMEDHLKKFTLKEVLVLRRKEKNW